MLSGFPDSIIGNEAKDALAEHRQRSSRLGSASLKRMKWLGRGAAFGAGFILAPGLVLAVLILAAAIVVGLIMNWWILPTLAGLFIVAGVVEFFRQTREHDRKVNMTSRQWAMVHNAQHDPAKDDMCPMCRLGLPPRRYGYPTTPR
jgi:hypothetical protein